MPWWRQQVGRWCWLAWIVVAASTPLPAASPNIVVILVDDLGYGDLSSYGHPTIRTPHLDRMAREGQRWTQFYAGANVCTPSRAALLTGRWPVRSGMASNRRKVLTPWAAGGLPDDEITLAELLRERGYATAAVGKWHLGHLPQYLPTRQGFDRFSGTPYSNDELVAEAWRPVFRRRDYWNTPLFYEPRSEYWDIPWIEQEEIVERPVEQTNLTQRATEAGLAFIAEQRDRPFFLYLAYHMPHVPLFVSEAFRGRSEAGIYGDAVMELDDGVGRILTRLRQLELAENTLVVFTSDNGPWTVFGDHGGSPGLLRGDKGSTWEAGSRVPALFWWPGTIAPDTITALGVGMDIFTTVARLAGAEVPPDRPIDGGDLGPVLRGDHPKGERDHLLYFRGTDVWAIRDQRFKLHRRTRPGFGLDLTTTEHEPPLLFDLLRDPGETRDVAAKYPEVVTRLREEMGRREAALTRGPDQLAPQLDRGTAAVH